MVFAFTRNCIIVKLSECGQVENRTNYYYDLYKYSYEKDMFINILFTGKLVNCVMNYSPVNSPKKLPCEGWLCFLVGQKRSSSHLVVLKNHPTCTFVCRPHIFATCHLWKCRESVYWNLSYSLIILKVIFLKSNPFRFKETLILFNNKDYPLDSLKETC